MDEVTAAQRLQDFGAHHLERHLAPERAVMTQMTHAATNTTGLGHLRAISESVQVQEAGCVSSSALQIPQQPQVRKKRGPKAGRKAAAKAAAAAAAAAAVAAGGELSNKQYCWPDGGQTRLQRSPDPYAFHCESSAGMKKINYPHTQQSVLPPTTIGHIHAQRNEAQRVKATQLNLHQNPLQPDARLLASASAAASNEQSSFQRHTRDIETTTSNLRISVTQKQQSIDSSSSSSSSGFLTNSEEQQMIAHKQHLVPAASNQATGCQPQQLQMQQQHLPVGQTPRHVVSHQHHHAGTIDEHEQQQQQYFAGGNMQPQTPDVLLHQQQQQQQQQQPRQYSAANSNSSADTSQVYQNNNNNHQQQIISNNHHVTDQQHQMRFHQQTRQPVVVQHQQQTPVITSDQQQQQQYNHQYNSHQQPMSGLVSDPQEHLQLQQAQSQVPLPNQQLPYQQANQYEPQQQHQHQPPAQLAQQSQLQSSNHYVSNEQHLHQHQHQQHMINDPQQQRHHQNGPMRPTANQLQQTRVSPYSSTTTSINHHHHQQQQVRSMPASSRLTGPTSHHQQQQQHQQQYKPVSRDFQQQQFPPPPQHQHQNNSQQVTNYSNANGAGAYLINGTQPNPSTGPSFMEGDQTGSHTTLLQQQLNRQVPPQHQRLGPAQQQPMPGPNNPMHQRPPQIHAHPMQQQAPKQQQLRQQQPPPPQTAGYGPPPPIQLPPQAQSNKVRSATTHYVNSEIDLMDPYAEIQQPVSRLNQQVGSAPGAIPLNGDQCYQKPPMVRLGPTGLQQQQRTIHGGPVRRLSNQQHQQQQQQQQQQILMVENHQAPPPPPPHLLGNPTPPLTPNSNSMGGPRTISHPVADVSSWHHHNHHHQQAHHGAPPTIANDHVQHQPPPASGPPNRFSPAVGSPSMMSGPPQLPPPPLGNNPKPNHHHLHNNLQAESANNLHQPHQRIMPKSVNPNFQHHQHQHQHQKHNYNHHHAQQQPTSQVVGQPSAIVPVVGADQPRLTLPLRDSPLLGPFRLEHDEQFISKVFHIKPQLFEALSKSVSLMNPQAATVVQELQFRAYVVNNADNKPSSASQGGTNGDSLLAPNNPPQQATKPCSWPEHFQVSVNENVIHLDRSKVTAHRAVDIFQYCRMGDNVLEMQVNDCYCSHEFVLEAVDRPTLKAFMSSCFKSRRLTPEACIQKLKFNFGTPGFLVTQQQFSSSIVVNEYLSDFNSNTGIELTKARISLKCPISGRRMRTPTRGYHCKHLQCFDLEVFLSTNRERSRWNCPLCSLAVPFNMLELDQHQMDILHAMPPDTDDILLDDSGQWIAYYVPQQQQQQQQQTAKSTGTFHPQAPVQQPINVNQVPPLNHQPMRPQSGPIIPTAAHRNMQPQPMNQAAGAGSMSPWDTSSQQQQHLDAACHSPAGPVRRPASAISQPTGRRSANGSPLAKKSYSGQYSQQPQSSYFGAEQQQQENNQIVNQSVNDTDNLSPLAAMERTIIQHEQQMGPPPFDPNSLTSSPASISRNVPPATNAASSGINSSMISPNTNPAVAANIPQQPPVAAIQTSPAGPQSNAFSPAPHSLANSPAGTRMVPASPQQQQRLGNGADPPPQSPMQQMVAQQSASISKPATPSSMLMQTAPDAPQTPSQMQNSVSCISHNSPHVVGGSGSAPSNALMQQQQTAGVDHQPLSNGSASAGSITSSSQMTPSSQSLGSVGMGGDSRCGTAPLQIGNQLGLDDLMLPGISSHQAGMSHQFKHSPQIDEKNEIMMGKLMMDSSESLLHRNGELAMALEEAEWKQQLDRGKSEHLANFLNEPLMKKQQQQHYQQQKQQQQQQQQQQAQLGPGSKMLSGGLEPSEDEMGNQSHGSSPGHNIDQLDFATYLDADNGDNGADLPPDDSILDLFER